MVQHLEMDGSAEHSLHEKSSLTKEQRLRGVTVEGDEVDVQSPHEKSRRKEHMQSRHNVSDLAVFNHGGQNILPPLLSGIPTHLYRASASTSQRKHRRCGKRSGRLRKLKVCLARSSSISRTGHGLSLPFVVSRWFLEPIDICLVRVVGLDEGVRPRRPCSPRPRGPCSPWPRQRGVDPRNLRSLLRAPRSAEPQAPAPARIGLLNARSLANKTFILRDFFSSRSLDLLCVTETWIGAALPTATLTVEPRWSPVFTGESVTLKCEIESYSNWRYQWYKGSSRTAVNQYQTNTFTISSAADQDQYWCRGERDNRPSSSQPSNTVTLIVKEKPKPELTSSHKGAAQIGNPVVLYCKLDQSAGWRFYWFKHTQSPENETKTETHSYTISSVSVSDGGQYWCRAGRGDPVYYIHYSDALWISVTGE
ncbi:hypothetical protein MHYP_G00013530 [Metynnis hypsauchen]